MKVLQWICRALLTLAMLHVSAAPGWAGASPARRWPARLQASVQLAHAQIPGHSLPLRAWHLDGHALQGELLGIEMEPDSAYQLRLAHWQAVDPARSVLPRLGQELWLESHYQRGRAISGTFLGFDGPYLILGKVDGAEGPLKLVPLSNALLATTAGRLLLDGRELDRQRDWPPSRMTLLAYFPMGTQRIPLDSLQDLQVKRRGDSGGSAFITGFFVAVIMSPFIAYLQWVHGGPFHW